MGTAMVAPLLTRHPQCPLPNLCSHKFSNGQNYIARRASFLIRAGGRVGGSEWEKTHNGGPSTYQDDFEYDYDDEEFGFRKNSGKQRIWWSDDSSTTWGSDTGEEDDDDDDDDDEDGFGALEDSMGGFSSIFKLFRAFGWIVPAIIVSMLLGIGANAFVMALALPLAQSALSSVLDMIWERSPDSPRPKSRSRNRKKAYPGAASGRSRMRKERQQSGQNGKSSENYRSWVATDNVSAGKAEGRTRWFGGWDELDKQRRKEKQPKTATANEKGWQTQGKLSRRSRKRRTPLLVRLLIGFFPFLGFWSKLW